MQPTLADLRLALQADNLGSWLESTGLPEEARIALSRAITHDRGAWETYPASLESSVVARSQGLPGIAGLQASWEAELRASGQPWVRSLHPVPLPSGCLATLSEGSGPDLTQFGRIEFRGNDLIVAEPIRFHPSVQDPSERRKERLLWHWKAGRAEVQPFPEIASRGPEAPYPRFTKGGWGPVSMIRSSSAKPVVLPCPREGTADAQVSKREALIVVSGSHDEYAGGFVWFVKASTAGTVERLETDSPVWSVHESEDGSVVLARTSKGLVCWTREKGEILRRSSFGRPKFLRITADSVDLSPNGECVVARTKTGIQVWSIDAGPRGTVDATFPASFSPDGSRLVRGPTLFDGESGQQVAAIPVVRHGYLEGGPAQPWFHLGNRLLTCLWSSMKAWESSNGERVDCGSLRFPHWYSVSYNHNGDRVVALRKGDSEVRVHEIPTGEESATITLSLPGADAVAISPSGRAVAAAKGPDIEVRTLDGELVLEARHPVDNGSEDERDDYLESSLQFVDEDHLASRFEKDGWRVFRLSNGTSEPAEAPRLGLPPDRGPSDWHVTVRGHLTVFKHQPSGIQIALPVAGDWRANPSTPTILACDDAHVDLRSGG